jgi:hypothetical protein
VAVGGEGVIAGVDQGYNLVGPVDIFASDFDGTSRYLAALRVKCK